MFVLVNQIFSPKNKIRMMSIERKPFGKTIINSNDTNVLKGFAILLMLCHHLFFYSDDKQGLYNDLVIGDIHVLNYICRGFGNFCVVMFVFLSGFGLSVSCNKIGKIGSVIYFYKKRYAKLMLNYWLIWLLFVPIGVFVFQRDFASVYGENTIIKVLIDFLGIASVFDIPRYNTTWWFYSCIIILYLLFPLYYKLRKYWYINILLAIVIWRLKVPFLLPASNYQFVFLLGLYMAENNISMKLKNNYRKVAVLLIFGILVLLRCDPQINNLLIDLLLCYLMVSLYCSLNLNRGMKKILSFYGRHSFNIYLFHSFVFYYYFNQFVYWNPNPVLIYFTLLLYCTVISILLEKFKSIIKFNQIQKFIIG